MSIQKSFFNDQEVAQRVLDHVRDHTTDEGHEIWREPVGNYRSEERLEREITQVLRRSPTPFCPSAALPEPGSFVAREAAGTPVLAVRGQDGVVRAFRNACRHRGMELAKGSGCSKAFVCPYHGWTYRLDGRLQHVPHERGFPGLEKEDHGLVPIVAEERLGLVYLTQDQALSGTPPWEGVPELILPEQELLGVSEFETPVNWKVYLEGFLEGYHIRPTHKDTFYPYGYDNLNVIELCGRNGRVTFPFRRIEKLADVPPADRRIDGLLTYAYHLFPNAVVTVLSRHTNLVILEPIGIDRTRFVSYMLANLGEGDDLESVKRDAAFVNDTGAAEDLAVVEAIQRGMSSGANEFYTFGHFETLIGHFHRNLAAALEEAAT